MTGYYRFAGTISEIEHMHELFARKAKDYAVAGEAAPEGPVLRVCVSQNDIDAEREASAAEDIRDGIPVREFSDAYLETLAIYRKLCDKLAFDDVMLFHCSAIEYGGRAYVFTAPSGTGKSTHAAIWRRVFGDKVRMINDDKPLIRMSSGNLAGGKDSLDTEGRGPVFTVYGTPWDGKHRISSNISAPLAGICFLSQGPENVIEPMPYKDRLPRLFTQVYRPSDRLAMAKVIGMIGKMADSVPVWQMSCNMEDEAAMMSFKAMCQPAE